MNAFEHSKRAKLASGSNPEVSQGDILRPLSLYVILPRSTRDSKSLTEHAYVSIFIGLHPIPSYPASGSILNFLVTTIMSIDLQLKLEGLIEIPVCMVTWMVNLSYNAGVTITVAVKSI